MIVYLKNIINETLLNASLNEDQVNKEDVAACLNFINDNLNGNIYFAIENLQSGIVNESHVDDYIKFNISYIKEHNSLYKNIKVNKKIFTSIDESIHFLINNEKTPKNFNIYEHHYNLLKQHLITNETRLNEDVIYKNYTELLSKIPEDVKIILEELSLIENKEEYFNTFQNDILNILKEELFITSSEKEKLLLYEAKDNVLSKAYTEKTYVQDIIFMNKIKSIIRE